MKKITLLFFFLLLAPLAVLASQQRQPYQEGTLINIKNEMDNGEAVTFSVKIKNVIYDGRKFKPGAYKLRKDPRKYFIVNDTVDVRFDPKEKFMFLKRPDGKEVKLQLVRKERVVLAKAKK